MAKRVRGMEFLNEYVSVEDLNAHLEEMSLENWAVQAIVPGHANIFEMGTQSKVLVIFKRPKKDDG